jgi:hypothetical protein
MGKARGCRGIRAVPQEKDIARIAYNRRLPWRLHPASDGPDESEFVVINFFDSIEAVIRFAGPDHAVPVFEPEAKSYLSRIENFATHYEVKAQPS